MNLVQQLMDNAPQARRDRLMLCVVREELRALTARLSDIVKAIPEMTEPK